MAAGRGQSGGSNIVLHEFAHQLDMRNDRAVDGTPPLADRGQYDRWQQVMTSEYERLVRDCRKGRSTLLDCYGATDIGEFFAVATECFFERPNALTRQHRRLYEILRDYYGQDPAA